MDDADKKLLSIKGEIERAAGILIVSAELLPDGIVPSALIRIGPNAALKGGLPETVQGYAIVYKRVGASGFDYK